MRLIADDRLIENRSRRTYEYMPHGGDNLNYIEHQRRLQCSRQFYRIAIGLISHEKAIVTRAESTIEIIVVAYRTNQAVKYLSNIPVRAPLLEATNFDMYKVLY